MITKNVIILGILLLPFNASSLTSCTKPEKEVVVDDGGLPSKVTDKQDTPEIGSSVDGVRIAWDYGSEKKLSDQGGYARIIRLREGGYIAVFEDHNGNVVRIKSNADGTSWGAKKVVFPCVSYTNGRVNAANAEICELADGTLLCGANYRPSVDGLAEYSIAVSRSTDGGQTWKSPKTIYKADKISKNGCWEPAFLQLPDGTVHVYFANEAPYTASAEQEISMLSSVDSGVTWTTEPVKVSFRAKCRDGMPVPVIFNDEIVVAIEDNKDGKLKPYTVRSKVSNPWSQTVEGSSEGRDFTLIDEIDASTYMGAPYLMKLPTGESVICYQTTENRSSNWALSTMEIAIGDKTARNFTCRSQPFNVPQDREALWNSLMLWDDLTIVAVTSTNKDGGAVAPIMKKGRIINTFAAQTGDITVYPLFVGSTGYDYLNAGIAVSDSTIVMECIVSDSSEIISDKCGNGDGVYFYIDSIDKSWAKPYAGVYRMWLGRDGKVCVWEGNNGQWTEIDSKPVNAAIENGINGYTIKVSIDKSLFAVAPAKSMRVAMMLSAYSNATSNHKEFLAYTRDNQPCTWVKVEL